MRFLKDDISMIMRAESNVIMDCRSFLLDELIQLAETAKNVGVNIKFNNLTFPITDILKIAKAGKNNVTFEL